MKDIPEQVIKQVRNFNRFYNLFLGVVNQSVLDSPFSMAEVRVLYEIKYNEEPSASEINTKLKLDPGYLSRIVRRFEKDELLEKERSPYDGRAFILTLTPHGEKILAALEKVASQRVASLLAPMTKEEIQDLVRSMNTIETLFSEGTREVTIREAKPGEMGIVASRQSAFAMDELELDGTYEAALFDEMTQFLKNQVNGKGRAWVADYCGSIVGSLAVDHAADKTAVLRWFLVDQEFRRMGIGKRLMEEALKFCSENSYRKVQAWAFTELRFARRLFETYGFSPSKEENITAWGADLKTQRWDYQIP